MFKLLKAIDGVVLDYVYQPAANRLQNLGSPKQISMFCLMGFLVSLGAGVAFKLVTQNTLDVFDAVFFLLGPLVYWGNGTRDFTSKARNPLRILPVYMALRLFALPMSVWESGAGLVNGFTALSFISWITGLCLTSQFYFEACDKPPPPPPALRRSAAAVWASGS